MEITIVLPEDFEDFKKKHDVTKEYHAYDDDNKQTWLGWKHPLEELYFCDAGTPELSVSVGTDNGVSVFLDIPVGELVEQLIKFNVIEDICNYLETNATKIKKSTKEWKGVKKLLKSKL